MKLEEKLGKEEAKEFIKAIDEAVKELSILRKLELKDELTKELATKADIREVRAEITEVRAEIAEVRAEIAEVRAELKAEIDSLRAELKKLEGYVKIMIVLLLIAIALYSPVFAELVKGLLKP